MRENCLDFPEDPTYRISQGALVNAVYSIDDTHFSGASYQFDSSQNAFIYFGTSEIGGELTISFSAKWTTFEQNSQILDFGQDNGSDNIRIGNVGTTNTLSVAIHSSSNVKQKQFNSILVVDTWTQFVVLIEANSEITLYKNGVEVAGIYTTNDHSDSVPNLTRSGCYLGRSWEPLYSYFNGSLDEIFIYTKILSQTELNCVFDQCNGYNCNKCEYNDQTCYSCAGTRVSPPVCSCVVGEYEDPSLVCQVCEYPCASCTSPTDCITCSTEENRNSAPVCGCNDLSWDNNGVCELLEDISFKITQSDQDKIFYNEEGHEPYLMKIQFSVAFELDNSDDTVENHLEIEIEGHDSKSYSIKFSQDSTNSLVYHIELQLGAVMRERKITVSFNNPEQFTDWLGNHLEDKSHSTKIKDYFFFTDQQRDISDTFALLIQIMIYVCLIPAIPLLFFDRFWKISIALDPLQLIYLLGFINVRLSINGVKTTEQTDLFRSFNFPTLYFTSEREQNEAYLFVKVDTEFRRNIEPILYVYGIFFFIHLFLRFIMLIGGENVTLKLRPFVQKYFEYRFHIDYWQMTMSVLAVFAYIKYRYFDDSYSAFFAMFVGFLLFLSPIFCFYQLYIFRDKAKWVARNEVGTLMFPYDEFGHRKGFMYKNMWQFVDADKKHAIFFIVFFLARKLMYAFILVSMNSDLQIQIGLIMGMNFVYLVLFIIRRPFMEKRDNYRVIFSEIIMFIAMGLLVRLEEDTSEDESSRFQFTWYYLFCFAIMILFHAFFSMFELIYLVYIIKTKKTTGPVFEGDFKEAQKKKQVRRQTVRMLVQDEDANSGDATEVGPLGEKIEKKVNVVYSDAPTKKKFTEDEMRKNKELFQQQNAAFQDQIQSMREEEKIMEKALHTTSGRKPKTFGRGRNPSKKNSQYDLASNNNNQEDDDEDQSPVQSYGYGGGRSARQIKINGGSPMQKGLDSQSNYDGGDSTYGGNQIRGSRNASKKNSRVINKSKFKMNKFDDLYKE